MLLSYGASKRFVRIAKLVVILGCFAQYVHADGPLDRLNLFKSAVEAVGAAGDAVAKLTDGVKHLVVTASDGRDFVQARSDYDRLKDLSARATILAGAKQVIVVQSIDDYLAAAHPTADDWQTVTASVQSALDGVGSLLDAVRTERSDFVLEDAYAKFNQSLAGRGEILGKIATLPQPQSREERHALVELDKKYKRLLANFQDAIKALNEYLKNQPGHERDNPSTRSD